MKLGDVFLKLRSLILRKLTAPSPSSQSLFTKVEFKQHVFGILINQRGAHGLKIDNLCSYQTFLRKRMMKANTIVTIKEYQLQIQPRGRNKCLAPA